MKSKFAYLVAVACIQPVLAQIVVQEPLPPAPPVEVVRETVIEVPIPPVIDYPPRTIQEPGFVRRHLLVEPREVVIPAPPTGTVVETVERRDFVEVPGQPRRIYNVERNVVVVQGRELPYVTIPVLFEKETAKLLDVESRVALEETAAAILEVLKTNPAAVFDIEGHTSTDGTDEFNMTLSGARARRTHTELTNRYMVPATALSAHGYGEMYPSFPAGTEEQMVLDRRVLVVRTK